MNQIVLPSGNVTPSLSEQEEYNRLWRLARAHRPRRKYIKSPHVQKLRAWDVSTSGESTFRQSGVLPKTISEKECNRRSWREHKGFQRDNAKRNGHFCVCKITDAREGHRAWVRNVLRDTLVSDPNAWEELLEYDKDMFTSGWDCC